MGFDAAKGRSWWILFIWSRAELLDFPQFWGPKENRREESLRKGQVWIWMGCRGTVGSVLCLSRLIHQEYFGFFWGIEAGFVEYCDFLLQEPSSHLVYRLGWLGGCWSQSWLGYTELKSKIGRRREPFYLPSSLGIKWLFGGAGREGICAWAGRNAAPLIPQTPRGACRTFCHECLLIGV